MPLNLLLSFLGIITGLTILWLAGEKVVEYALQMAEKFNVSTFFVGFVILAVFADIPEIAIAITSALRGISEISAGDLVGSSFCDVALVTGITTIVAGVINVSHREQVRLLSLLGGTSVIMLVAFAVGTLYPWHGYLLIAIYLASLILVWKKRYHKDEVVVEKHIAHIVPHNTQARWLVIAKLILCLILVLLSSSGTVYCVELFATGCGLSLETIGATILAAGTSLPELSLSLHALRRKEFALALGPTLGTVLEQCTLILGLLVVLSKKPVDLTPMRGPAVFMFVGFSIVAISLLQKQLKRPTGIVLVSLFVCYMAYHFI